MATLRTPVSGRISGLIPAPAPVAAPLPTAVPALVLALTLALALALSWPVPAQAQSASLSGVVVASDGSGPLSGVRIVVLETGAQAVTNAQGRFKVAVPSDRPVTLEFSKPGFSSKQEGLTRNASGVIVSLQRS